MTSEPRSGWFAIFIGTMTACELSEAGKHTQGDLCYTGRALWVLATACLVHVSLHSRIASHCIHDHVKSVFREYFVLILQSLAIFLPLFGSQHDFTGKGVLKSRRKFRVNTAGAHARNSGRYITSNYNCCMTIESKKPVVIVWSLYKVYWRGVKCFFFNKKTLKLISNLRGTKLSGWQKTKTSINKTIKAFVTEPASRFLFFRN